MNIRLWAPVKEELKEMHAQVVKSQTQLLSERISVRPVLSGDISKMNQRSLLATEELNSWLAVGDGVRISLLAGELRTSGAFSPPGEG